MQSQEQIYQKMVTTLILFMKFFTTNILAVLLSISTIAIGYSVLIALSQFFFVYVSMWGCFFIAPLIYFGCFALTRFSVINVPLKICKSDSLAPGLIIVTCMMFFGVFNLLIYEEMNVYEIPNWHFIMIFVALIYGSLLQLAKSQLLINLLD
ncbi:hypothetical protein GCM10023149_29090 [Mucilaginibacter gynuensis]|uniref:Uncharacterized protein n=1 Tax=Mucilaginibacter gynuensis TaxID=1302236 RepID=A0ABP8GLC8_9SPHI